MKKIFKFIIFNLVFLLLLLAIIEIVGWKTETFIAKKINPEFVPEDGFKFHPEFYQFELSPEHFPDISKNYGRLPVNLEYTKKPIVIFGCSFAYGFNLENEQTFSYKLSELTKRPVYNQAFNTWGVQHMLYQTELDSFYEKVPEPEYVIYIFIDDQIRRQYLISFDRLHFLTEYRNLRYKEKNGMLVEIDNKNPILKFIRRLYITTKVNQWYVETFINKNPNKMKYYDFCYKHFIQSKNNMEKRWKNTKFIVLMYNPAYKEDNYLKEKLESQNFIVIKTDDLTTENLQENKYFQPNLHPTEEAWDLLTPLLIEKLHLE